MSDWKIALPAYKNPPPMGGTTVQWWKFFLSPLKADIALCMGVNLPRHIFFRIQPLFLGVLIGWLADGALKAHPEYAATWIAFYAFLSIIVFFSLFYVIPASGRVMDTVSKHISLYGFRHYLSLSESWHENRASGEKLQRLLKARDSSYNFMEQIFWDVAQFPAIAVAVLIWVTALGAPVYYIFLFYGMIISYVWISYASGEWMRKRYENFYKTQENVVANVYEFLISTATVRFFNLKKRILDKAADYETVNHQSRQRLLRTSALRWAIVDSVAMVWIVAVIGIATYQVIHGELSAAAYSTIIVTAIHIWTEMEPFAVIYVRLLDNWEGVKRLTEILNLKPAIADAPNARDLHAETPDIAFREVTFAYNNKNVIEKLSLHVAPHEKIGLMGPSGAGKSTIVKLLLRFYDPQEGQIAIGDANLKEITRYSLQDHIAVIPQDVVLFNRPLMENIRYGKLEASDADVIEAAKKAHAHEFIEKLPEGYETMVGERGVKLSGGQRQRIAIARAILKNAPILVLDEATSSLDSESEKHIQESLAELMKDKTVIAIAHRLSTIAHLDRLVVMEEGRVIEQGSHAELLKSGGLYARLWAMQSGGFLPE